MPELVARVIVLERLGRLEGFLDDWVRTGPEIPLEILIVDPEPENPGEGCYWSHVAALDHDGPLLVLEDDCYFTHRPEIPAVPPCDILYLGGQHFVPPTPLGDWPGVVQLNGNTNRTHAYIVWEPRKLAAMMTNDRRATYPDIAIARYPELVRLGLDPWVAGQRAGWSSIKEAELPDRIWQRA